MTNIHKNKLAVYYQRVHNYKYENMEKHCYIISVCNF